MNCETFLFLLLRSSVLLLCSAVFVGSLLRFTRCRRPGIHRLAWFIVLLQGVLWVHCPVKLAVLHPPQTPLVFQESTAEEPFEISPPLFLPRVEERPVFYEPVVFEAHEEIFHKEPENAAPYESVAVFHAEHVETVPPPEKSVTFSPIMILLTLWIAGFLFLVTLKSLMYYRCLRQIRRAMKPHESDLAAFEQLRAALGVPKRRKIRLLLTEQIGPALARTFGGTAILVPKSLWEEATEEVRAGILRHELSHERHNDIVKTFFAWLLAALQWFNPAAWFALKRFCAAAEWRCDAEAYGNREDALLQFAEAMLMLHKTGDRYIGVLQNFKNKDLLERIRKLSEQQTLGKESTMKHVTLLFCVTLLLALGLIRFELVAKEPAADETAAVTENAEEIETPKNAEEHPQVVGVCVSSNQNNPVGRAHLRIHEILDEPFRCDVDDSLTFEEALSYINKKTDIPLVLDPKSFEPKNNGGKDLVNAPVSLRFPFPMRTRDVLDYVTKQVGMDWAVDNETILILRFDNDSTAVMITKRYCVADLMRVIREPKYDESGLPLPYTPQDVEGGEKAFEPLVCYIKTMVPSEHWESEGQSNIQPYYNNLSLVIRQSEDVHAKISALLKDLRSVQDIQLRFQVEILPLRDKSAKASQSGLILFSGGEAGTVKADVQGDYFVKLSPISAKTVPLVLAEENRPFMFTVPKNGTWSVEGIASRRNGSDIIKATLKIDGKEPETRVFYASALFTRAEERFSPGPTALPVKPREIMRLEYEVADLVTKLTGEVETESLIELITSVTGRDGSWGSERVEITKEGTTLIVAHEPAVHREISDLLKQLRSINNLRIECEISTCTLSPDTNLGTGEWKTVAETLFNGQVREIPTEKDFVNIVRIKPSKKMLLSEDPLTRQQELLATVPKGSSLNLQGVVSADRKHVRLAVAVDGEELTSWSFNAEPIEP